MTRPKMLIAVLLATMAMTATAIGPVAVAGASAGARWHVFTYIHCDEPTCGGSEVLPPWMATLKNPFLAITDGQGHFYHRATIYATGRAGHPQRCNATLFDKPFSGRCVVSDFGQGYVAEGCGGAPRDFWVTSETARFNGGPWRVDPFAPYPIDTCQYATAGHYSEVDLLGQDYPGVTAYMDVTRTPR